jgi:hypothetical protein
LIKEKVTNMCSCNKCCCAHKQAPSALSKIEGIQLKIDAASNPLCLLPGISFIITERGACGTKEEIEIPFTLSLVGLGGLGLAGSASSPIAPLFNALAPVFNALAQAAPVALADC